MARIPVSRRALLAGGAALTASARAARAAPLLAPPDGIDRAVENALTAHACPGAAIAVARNGAIVLSRSYGFANVETRTPVSGWTIFRIGSLTKQFTAAAILKLAAMNRVDLRVPVATYLPSAHPLPHFSLLELMNQTAGLHSDDVDGPPTVAKTQIGLADDIFRQGKPFDFDPGTAWLYSNANYIVLGAVIESVMAMPLERAMAELIFTPLSLTTAAIDRPGDVVLDRASGYTPTDDAAAPFDNAPYIDVSQTGGAGAMRATAIDLCRWYHALLGGKLFDRAHIDLMLAAGRLRDGRPSSANRFSAEDAHYGDVEYACGLLISGPSNPHPSILHYGAIKGFAAVLQTYVTNNLTFAVLCNGDIGPAMPFSAIRKEVIAGYLA